MNATAFAPRFHYERLRLTVKDVASMVEVGIIDPDAQTELIDGELFYMPVEGGGHISYKAEIVRWFARRLSEAWRLVPDSSLHLGPQDTPAPDVYICAAEAPLDPIPPTSIALVIEVSDTSLGRDLETKAPLYARYGIGEYWVVDIGAGVTHVHRAPWNGGYPKPRPVPFTEGLSTEVLPDLPALVIADLSRLP